MHTYSCIRGSMCFDYARFREKDKSKAESLTSNIECGKASLCLLNRSQDEI